MNNVYVTEINGKLTDHYDSSRKVVRLSKDVFHGDSIASCSVAAHEVGHAIQDKEGYSFMRFRSLMFPLVNISSYCGYLAILIGVLFESLEYRVQSTTAVRLDIPLLQGLCFLFFF